MIFLCPKNLEDITRKYTYNNHVQLLIDKKIFNDVSVTKIALKLTG